MAYPGYMLPAKTSKWLLEVVNSYREAEGLSTLSILPFDAQRCTYYGVPYPELSYHTPNFNAVAKYIKEHTLKDKQHQEAAMNERHRLAAFQASVNGAQTPYNQSLQSLTNLGMSGSGAAAAAITAHAMAHLSGVYDTAQGVKKMGTAADTFAQSTGRISMLKEFKNFIAEHRDLIFTVVLITLADSFLLNGALRGRLQAILDKTLSRLDSRLDSTPKVS